MPTKVRGKGENTDGPSVPAWMVTYADLMGLLLCFFVLIVSFSTLEEKRIKEALSSLKGALGVLESSQQPAIRISAIEAPIPEIMNLQVTRMKQQGSKVTRSEVREKMDTMLRKLGLNNAIKVQTREGGTRLTLPCDGILFAPGSAELLPQGKEELKKIAKLFEVRETRIRIEGHTDSTPYRGSKYLNNWDLSGARALAVLMYYTEEEGWRPESRFSYMGLGSGRPADPEQGNSTEEARAANRRVEIYIEAYEDERLPLEDDGSRIPEDDWSNLLQELRPARADRASPDRSS